MREGGAEGGLKTQVPGPPPSLSSSVQIILVGVVHGDPRGFERAWKVLAHFRPDLVTVEVSRFSVRYRECWQGRWQRLLKEALEALPAAARVHPALERLAAQVALPFEVRVAREFSRECAVPWRPLDAGDLARRHLPRYASELLRPENVRAILETPHRALEDWVASEFKRARLAYGRSPWRFPASHGCETLKRERLLARRLRRLAGQGRRLVHLGGWEHLVSWEDGSGLMNRLSDLNPQRLLLDSADLLPAGWKSC